MKKKETPKINKHSQKHKRKKERKKNDLMKSKIVIRNVNN